MAFDNSVGNEIARLRSVKLNAGDNNALWRSADRCRVVREFQELLPATHDEEVDALNGDLVSAGPCTLVSKGGFLAQHELLKLSILSATLVLHLILPGYFNCLDSIACLPFINIGVDEL